jgi:hypothetical protein
MRHESDSWSKDAVRTEGFMRLSAEQVKQGILHADVEVRDFVLEYFQRSLIEDPAIMTLFIQAYEQFGWHEVSTYDLPVYPLGQTAETVQWLIDRLQETMPDVGLPVRWSDRNAFLGSQVSMAPLELLAPHREAIQSLEALASEYQDDIHERFSLELMSPEDAWAELEALCEAEGGDEFGDFEYEQALRYVEVAARGGNGLKSRILEILAGDVPQEEEVPLHYLMGYAAEFAGRMHWHESIPLLNEVLSVDAAGSGEWLPGLCADALVRIGTDEVVQTAAAAYVEETLDYQFEIQPIFQSIHSDFAVRIAYELLREMEDEDADFLAREVLALCLAHQFDPDLIEPLRAHLGNHRRREVAGDIRKALVVVASVAGTTFPEFDEWHAAMRATTVRNRMIAESDEPEKDFSEFDRPFADPQYLEDELDEFDDAGAVPNDFGSGDPLAGLASYSEVAKLRAEPSEFDDDLYPQPIVRLDPKVGRNDPCPCGSGKKFKKCCLKRE